jgi:cytochrome b6
MLQTVYRWIDERLEISPIIDHALKKRVPDHKHSAWYYWGGICLFFFMVQVVTGILLMIYYRPGPDAYDSVRQITYEIRFGWLIRSVHAWSANLMIGAVFVHMFSVFFMKAYRNPREFGWWSGLALLALCMVFGFSGYLLPMDELAFFATRVGLAIPDALPGMSQLISALLRGGPEVSSATLQRFFALHVVVLPAIFVPLLGFHLWLVQKHGNALPPSEEAKPAAERRSIPFFPNFAMRDMAVWLMALNLLALLVALFPLQLDVAADALKPAPVGIHPEWYFMSQFEALKLLGHVIPGTLGEFVGLGVFGVGMGMWAAIPLFDSRVTTSLRARLTTWFGLLFLAALILLTIIGYIEVL